MNGAYKITAQKAALNAGYDLDIDADRLFLMVIPSVVPACCSEGCEVEPDGTCQHGFEAVTLVLMKLSGSLKLLRQGINLFH